MLKKVSIEISRTLNLGNFESLRVQAGMEVDVPETIPNETAFDDVYTIVSTNLKTIINKEMGLVPEEEEKEIKRPSTSRWRSAPTIPE